MTGTAIKSLVGTELMAKLTPELKNVDYANIDLPTYEEYMEVLRTEVENRTKAIPISKKHEYAKQRSEMEEKIRAFEKAYDLPVDFPTLEIFGNTSDYVQAWNNLLDYCVKEAERVEQRYANKCEKSKKCKVLGFTHAERIAADRIKAVVETDLGQFKMTVIEADGEHNCYHTRVLFHKL